MVLGIITDYFGGAIFGRKRGREGVKVGDRVVWLREPPQTNEAGKVKWIGIIENEEIAGIEFDRQLGLGSGWYKNRQLFTCEPQCGGLVAVAGLILEDDYFYNPNIPSSSSSPVSPYNDRKVSNKRLTSGGGSAGHSSPSPSSSSSTSLEIDQRNQVVQEQQSHYGSRQQFSQPVDYTSHTWNSPAKTELDESTLLVGDFTVVPAVLPVVDCGDGHFDPPSGEYKYPKREIMPIPHIVQPIREEDVDRINGRQKGIQGHRNSCYLDATLFSMFSFSSVFDSILLQDYRHVVNRRDEEDESLSRNVQKILRDDIVNPLRKNLYCNASNVMKLRETMEHLDGKLTCEEMDPQEFLQLLFDKVLNLSEFMSLSSGQSDFFHQVLVQQTDQDRHKIPSIQQLFEQSLMLQELKLKGVPQPALILQMPRSGNKYKMYDGILPNLTIDITDLLEDIPRTCIICGSLATHECSSCYGKFNSGGKDRDSSICSPVGSGAESTAFCETCVNQIHKRKDRQGHMQTVMPIKYSFSASQYFPNAINTSSSNDPSRYYFGQSQIGNWGNPSFNRNPTPLISSIPPPSNSNFSPYASRSIPRITMDLFAVICIETSHFVSFVKCGSDRKAPWVFFDSMADRVENVNGTGHNIPQVRLLPNMGSWLDSLENKGVEKLMMEESNFPPDLKRLLADPYICLYYSKESSMYS
ncbi:ubiquitin carboxyl-terminal hydrolase CYLD isoform X2 [Folsomia candida]|uniref:ubiquitin carboxyl-terminal hydrolase CYLD isoform X2 n=1 Tax=Folsomia candida TaxID=158441 RepID=UPI000B8FE7B4|nr:ubiquitin carboxyl-terminal hydrolase CYLD isoform X2 [Folsomia candida]